MHITLGITENTGSKSAVITITGAHASGTSGPYVGEIKRHGNIFKASTQPCVSGVDGLEGQSIADVKRKIDAAIAQGKVSIKLPCP